VAKNLSSVLDPEVATTWEAMNCDYDHVKAFKRPLTSS
jgi:hypothetical protein